MMSTCHCTFVWCVINVDSSIVTNVPLVSDGSGGGHACIGTGGI